MGRLSSGYLKLGVLGTWMTFKNAEMAKTLKNGLSIIETNLLNLNWSDFAILSGLTLHQFQKKNTVKCTFKHVLPNSDGGFDCHFSSFLCSPPHGHQ